ncbi:MAG TPA: GDSL-type esterase/lipase family protein [Candidatus Limnocylindria bacterium]
MRRGATGVSMVIFALLAISCANGPAASGTDTPRATATARASGSATASPSPTATPAPASVRYVAIGASDTVGVGATDPAKGSWPALIASRLPTGSTYVNLGVSGSLALQAVGQQLPGAIAQRPTVVSLWLAVNDLNATIQPSSYRDALAQIVDGLVQRTTATVFVGNVPDLRAVPVYASIDKNALLAQIRAYNDVVTAMAAKDPARVVPVDLFTGSAALVSTATVSQDGFHPSDEGYQLIADRFATAMRARGVPLR